MKTSLPLVSVVIPLYNKEDSISTTVNSILKQSFIDFEIIIVNDGSTDNSLNIVSQIEDSRIRIVNQENKGISAARNRGIAEGNGKWILFLDADDILLPEALVNFTQNIKDSGSIIAAGFISEDTKGNINKFLPTSEKKVYSTPESIYRAWVTKNLFLRAGSFIVPSEFAKKTCFNEDLCRFEDMDFVLQCAHQLSIVFIPKTVMVYQVSYASASKPNPYKWANDYLFYLPFETGCFWKNCILGDLLNIALVSYPEKKDVLLSKYQGYLKYRWIARFIYYSPFFRRDFIQRCRMKLKHIFRI